MPFILLNMLTLNATWFACVLGGASGLPWIGVAAAAVMVALHLRLSPLKRPELCLLGSVGVLGAVWETFMVGTGLLIYPSGILIAGTAPVWIMALWVAFASCLNVSMRWLKGRYVLAMAVGAVGGPMGFFAGSRLGGVEFTDTSTALALLAVGWGVLMPAAVRLAEVFDGWPQSAVPESARPPG